MTPEEKAAWDEFPPGGMHASSDFRKAMEKPTVGEIIRQTAVHITNLYAMSYMSVQGNAGCWGEQHTDDLIKILTTALERTNVAAMRRWYDEREAERLRLREEAASHGSGNAALTSDLPNDEQIAKEATAKLIEWLLFHKLISSPDAINEIEPYKFVLRAIKRATFPLRANIAELKA